MLVKDILTALHEACHSPKVALWVPQQSLIRSLAWLGTHLHYGSLRKLSSFWACLWPNSNVQQLHHLRPCSSQASCTAAANHLPLLYRAPPRPASQHQESCLTVQVVADGLHILIGDVYNRPSVQVRRSRSNHYEDVSLSLQLMFPFGVWQSNIKQSSQTSLTFNDIEPLFYPWQACGACDVCFILMALMCSHPSSKTLCLQ